MKRRTRGSCRIGSASSTAGARSTYARTRLPEARGARSEERWCIDRLPWRAPASEWRCSSRSGITGAAHKITLAGGRRPCLTSSLCNQLLMARAVAAALRSGPSRRPSLQSRLRTRAGARKCLKAEAFSGLTRPSLQSLVVDRFLSAARADCARHRPGGLCDSCANSHSDAVSTSLELVPGCPGNRCPSGDAASAIAVDAPVGTGRPSNIVASALEGARGRGGRTRRTNGQVS